MNKVQLDFSIIIPVFNRPQEIEELFKSLKTQTYKSPFEIIIVEDGSTIRCDEIVNKYKKELNINYFYKENTGAGQSRNAGMNIAKGNYFIILDSDVILPKNYLIEIKKTLKFNYTNAFAGADTQHKLFTPIQKAINFAMTSFLTTGGLRNNKGQKDSFQLRSFNMGLSKKAFKKTKGFNKQNYGEDIALSYKLLASGFKTQFIENAFVYHKRRSDFKQFFKQTFNFGAARPILNIQHKYSARITYWFPSLFIFGLIISVFALFLGVKYFCFLYLLYFFLLFLHALSINKNISIAFLSVLATGVQFLGYGFGFMRSQFRLRILKKTIKETFPKMFN